MRYFFLMLVLVSITLGFAGLLRADVPLKFNYQGHLVDSEGQPISNPSQQITFTIYSDPEGTSQLWTSGPVILAVENGVFDYDLGPLPEDIFQGANRYLGIKIGGDAEIQPRTQLISVPYAMHALQADSDGDWIADGNNIYRNLGHIGIGDATPESRLDVEDDGTGYAAYFKNTTPDLGGYPAVGIYKEGWGHALDVYARGDAVYGGCVGAKIWNEYTDDQALWVLTYGTGPAAVFSCENPASTNYVLNVGAGGSGKSAYFSGYVNVLGNIETGGISAAGSGLNAGQFETDYPSSSANVLSSEFTASGSYDARAVYGKCKPADYYGYGGYFEGGFIGARGIVNPTGSSSYYGVQGSASGGNGTNYGVYGSASGGSTNWAGYFSGNCRVTGTFDNSKGSYMIDHPTDPGNQYLCLSNVGSPDMMNIYNGNIITDANGRATVELPDYFEALNKDFRYQLTVIGTFAQAIVEQEISDGMFVIATNEPNVKVSWQVTGNRKDVFAKANETVVEIDKMPGDRGKYLHPELLGEAENLRIGYDEKELHEEESSR